MRLLRLACYVRSFLVNEIWHCRRRRYCCSNRKWVLLRKKSDSNTICMSRTHSIWQIASISDPDRDRKRRTNLAVTLFDFSSRGTVHTSSLAAFITSILLPFSYQIKPFSWKKKFPITRGSIFPSLYLIPTFNVRYHVIYLSMLSKTGHRYRKQMISSICT